MKCKYWKKKYFALILTNILVASRNAVSQLSWVFESGAQTIIADLNCVCVISKQFLCP